ncbi:bifunctional phosphoribosyl-AMP cyclohydrolase/phosphoribosyl-ATP diphosphatase HisIE [Lentiprolixibacter aurantiacus]|uniref:Histidine biosynthesis bifunctional protein HisIE n=1 Tax=Lentiprolixibacter aurantiacus TaxID=2993939 RepID=A0AAE3MKR1_9FLAO|nr:bifunctional phosphoribosyl-AMP cyclohydrolase/phosphoribosyl-ATP diphosphatase HisIE [Lentiprolixibacter aurantiacus]MCX2719555.1 bifunctional phosphoribosyl-AMP cyclohydrolase/phosphoribosyl-ATP diphosphatase HisIE [Lentiprolixibacter aurantiacus]
MDIDFEKNTDKLVPAIIQDAVTRKVLMLGYMNQDAWEKTQESGKVTFFSRSKNRLWTKGEESGNFLDFIEGSVDCDSDTLLLQVKPKGPTCHKGTDTCWGDSNEADYGFLSDLENIIDQRREADSDSSYVASLFKKGINKIAQKVGEEAVETVIEAKDNDTELFLNEAADLLFHYLILLKAKGHSLKEVVELLNGRHQER